VSARAGSKEERKFFFFEKKKQKTFIFLPDQFYHSSAALMKSTALIVPEFNYGFQEKRPCDCGVSPPQVAKSRHLCGMYAPRQAIGFA